MRQLILALNVIVLASILASCGRVRLVRGAGSHQTLAEGQVRVGDMILDADLLQDSFDQPQNGSAAVTGFRKYNTRAWPRGELPVVFNGGVTPEEKALFFEVCRQFSYLTQVKCFERDREIYPYILVTPEPSLGRDGRPVKGVACDSTVGVTRDQPVMHMPRENGCLSDRHHLAHELAHAFGLLHEHQRPDRDSYVHIDFTNIAPQLHPHFQILTGTETLGAYDFDSVTHYFLYAGAVSFDRPSIVPKVDDPSLLFRVGSGTRPSAGDGAGLARYYGPPVEIRPEYELNFQAEAGGCIVVDEGEECLETTGFRLGAGDEIRIRARPQAGFVFDRWEGDCAGTYRYEFVRIIASRDLSCRALFREGDPEPPESGETSEPQTNEPEEPPPPSAPAPSSDVLRAGAALLPGQSLVSSNGAFVLALQGDGNLVLYKRGVPVWATSTFGVPHQAVMQGDGNFVLYTYGEPMWSSDTHGNPGAWLVLQGDGNLVIYSARGDALWATGVPESN